MSRPNARVYRATKRNIAFLAQRLRAGELVAVPTETVYGLAANGFDARACAKIFKAKGRPAEDPLIVHIHAWSQVETICHVNEAVKRLAKAFWPGPLTLVLPKKPVIPDLVTAGRDSVAVRMPAHPAFRRLLKATGVPLAAPSANPFGYVSPTTVQHVIDGLGAKIRYILDGGPARIGLESTIVDLRDPARAAVLRPGFITAAQIAHVLRLRVRPEVRARPETDQSPPDLRTSGIPGIRRARGALAPGQLARHYSPRTRVHLHARLELPARPDPRHAYLLMRKPGGRVGRNVFWLDPRGDLRGAARRLFAMLRRLDGGRFDVIHAELACGTGLAHAINDRLRRAAAR